MESDAKTASLETETMETDESVRIKMQESGNNNENNCSSGGIQHHQMNTPISTLMAMTKERLEANNQKSYSDKFTSLISLGSRAKYTSAEEFQSSSEGDEGNSVNNRRQNFNNRDMELSLSDDDDDGANDGNNNEEDDEEEEDDVDYQEGYQNQQNYDKKVSREQKVQRIEGDYGDIQFFHHKLLLQQHLVGPNNDFFGSSVSSFGSQNGIRTSGNSASGGGGSDRNAGCSASDLVDSFSIEDCCGDDNGMGNSFSENPFVFPDNVMEYGEPQFFPGNCVGYLETILEETDEEFEEEEGCSGRHWWTADSDTDTDSVIQRVDNGQIQPHQHQHHHHLQQQTNRLNSSPCNNQPTVPHACPNSNSNPSTARPHEGNLKSVLNVEDLSAQSTFRSSASSRPFELEDLHLLDQLDLAFEETLMEPRRRSGFAAFGHQLHLLDQPLGTKGKNCQLPPFSTKEGLGERPPIQRSCSLDDPRSRLEMFSEENVKSHSDSQHQTGKLISSYTCDLSDMKNTKDDNILMKGGLGNAESKETFGSSLSPSSSDSEPHEVAEEDFFYSSPGSEESEEGSSSSDDSEKNGGGVVLAEFSLSQACNNDVGGLDNGSPFNSTGNLFGSAKNRRSFESPSASSRLKSFRSFDSLNALSGTELLFSKADTFPSFHYIKEDVEPGSSGSGSPSSPRCNLTSCSTNDVPGATTETAGGHQREDESQSLPSHTLVGLPPTFNKITKKNSYSSSTSTASSSSNSATGMMSTENLSEDSGIGPEGGLVQRGKRSCESSPDEIARIGIGVEGICDEELLSRHSPMQIQQEDCAKDYITKSEFALNPLVFSSLSSNSDSPSMNSVPSLDTQELSPCSGPELEGSDPEETERSTGESPIYSGSNLDTISHYSKSNLDFRNKVLVVDESASADSPGNPLIHPDTGTPEPASIQAFEKGLNKRVHCDDNPLNPSLSTTNEKARVDESNPCSTSIHPASNDRLMECVPHPGRDSQSIQVRGAKTPDNNKNIDNKDNNTGGNATLSKPNAQTSENVKYTIESLTEKSKAIPNTITNTNVPLDSSKQRAESTTLAFICRNSEETVVALDNDHEQNQNNGSENIIGTKGDHSHSNGNKPDLVLVKPKAKDLNSHNSIFTNDNDSSNASRRIVISAPESEYQPAKPSKTDRVGVIAVPTSSPGCGVPYDKEEIQEDNLLLDVEEMRGVGWNVNEIGLSASHSQLSSSSLPSTSTISSTSQQQRPFVMQTDLDLDSDPSSPVLECQQQLADVDTDDGDNDEDQYQQKNSSHKAYTRERSNSESEFESAESAVEEDSIALAYAIVNSPTKGSASSSPTQELNNIKTNNDDDTTTGTGVDDPMANADMNNVNSNRESGPVSTKLGSAAVVSIHGSNNDDGMRENVINFGTCSSSSTGNGYKRDYVEASTYVTGCRVSMDNSQAGQEDDDVVKANHSNDNNSFKADLCIKKPLHHHHQERDEDKASSHSHSHNNHYNNSISYTSANSTEAHAVSALLPLPSADKYNELEKRLADVEVPVGHELSSSRSVVSNNSSCADVVHHSDQELEKVSSSTPSQPDLCESEVDKLVQVFHNPRYNKYYYDETGSRRVGLSQAIGDQAEIDCINGNNYADDDEDDELVRARPIDPVHIGVVEVKKFTQLDSSVSRNQTFGVPDSESISHPNSTTTAPLPSTNSKLCGKADQAILGNSNFGFFGRSSNSSRSNSSYSITTNTTTTSTRNRPTSRPSSHPPAPPTIVKLELKPSSSVGFEPESSAELLSYGFPPPPPHPISETNSHPTQEGQLDLDWKEIPLNTSKSLSTSSIINPPVNKNTLRTFTSGSSIPTSSTTSTNAKSSKRDQLKDLVHLEDIKCGIHPDRFTIPLGAYTAAIVAVAPSIPSARLLFLNEEGEDVRTYQGEKTGISTITSSKTGSNAENIRQNIPYNSKGNSSGNPVATASSRGINNPRSSSKTLNPNPANGLGVVSSSNGSPSVPDILVGKQAHLEETDGKQGANQPANSTNKNHTSANSKTLQGSSSRMEVDTNTRGDDGRSTSPSGVPIKMRTYGARNEVEVMLVSSRTPSPAPVNIPPGSSTSSLKHRQPSGSNAAEGEETDRNTIGNSEDVSTAVPPAKAPRTRVHFSPVVSEISWRESYIDQGSEFSGSSEDIHAKLGDVNNPGDYCGEKTGAATSGSRDSGNTGNSTDLGGVLPQQMYTNEGSDSVVRPLQVVPSEIITANGENLSHRQPSPNFNTAGCKGPILVEKVQMRSSLLQGGDEDEDGSLDEDDELERKLTKNIHIMSERSSRKSPVDEDYLDGEDLLDEPRKETIQFKAGGLIGNEMESSVGSNGNGIDFYEDVDVEIGPINKNSGSTTLSMVPDLLSQCENATNSQTHVDVRIEEVGQGVGNKNGKPKPPARLSKSVSPPPQSEIPPPPLVMETELEEGHNKLQQQILPKIFAEDVHFGSAGKGGKSDSKNNSSSSLNKGKKSSKGFTLGSSTGSKKPGVTIVDTTTKEKDKEIEASKENKSKGTKPGFFERLSKIRISGGKTKKQKIHPKTDELDQAKPLRSANAVNINGSNSNGNSSTNGTSLPSGPSATGKKMQPILKKSPANSPTPVIPNYTMVEPEAEPDDESHQAFENILEEIAGIKSIQMRMEKSNGGDSANPSPAHKEMRSFAKRKLFYNAEPISPSLSLSPPVSPNGRSYSDLDKKLSQFKEETSKTRVIVSKSHPDLELIEDMVRQQSVSPEPPKSPAKPERMIKPPMNASNPQIFSSVPLPPSAQPTEPEKKKQKSSPKKSTLEGQKNEREWYKLLKSAAEKYYYRGSSSNSSSKDDVKAKTSSTSTTSLKTGVVETDLDTGTSREMLDAEILELDKVPSFTVSTSEIPSATAATSITTTVATSPGTAAKARSLTNLSTRLPLSVAPSSYQDDDLTAPGELNDFDERAKSYEFLLDDNQKSSSVPPENKLRLESRQLSEHELRIQRSLQRLNIPEWFKTHEAASGKLNSLPSANNGQSASTEKSATLSLLRRSEYGSSGGLAGGWAGLSAFKAPSMSSLQSSNGGRYSGSLQRSNFIRGRPATMSASVTRCSKESLVGSASHSPSAFERCSFTYGMPFATGRFSHGRMSNNSGSITPTSTVDSAMSTTTTSSYVKKPYLGWRSQERLNALAAVGITSSTATGPPRLSIYLPPEERLAADLLKTKVAIRPPLSDRPPLPKPPPRSERTALTAKSSSIDNQRSTSPSISTNTNASSFAVVTKINQSNNSIPLPSFVTDDDRSSKDRAGTSSNDIHNSIREVTKAISQYVAKGEEETPKPQPRKKGSGKKAVWMESSFVGRKPVTK